MPPPFGYWRPTFDQLWDIIGFRIAREKNANHAYFFQTTDEYEVRVQRPGSPYITQHLLCGPSGFLQYICALVACACHNDGDLHSFENILESMKSSKDFIADGAVTHALSFETLRKLFLDVRDTAPVQVCCPLYFCRECDFCSEYSFESCPKCKIPAGAASHHLRSVDKVSAGSASASAGREVSGESKDEREVDVLIVAMDASEAAAFESKQRRTKHERSSS